VAEPLPRASQRLYTLVELRELGPTLADKVREAEEAIYAGTDDPIVNWDAVNLQRILADAGLIGVNVVAEETATETRIAPSMLERWFGPAAPDGRPSYAQRLAAHLNAGEISAVRALYESALVGRIVPWRTVTALVTGAAPG
jgi:hypothetical protein